MPETNNLPQLRSCTDFQLITEPAHPNFDHMGLEDIGKSLAEKLLAETTISFRAYEGKASLAAKLKFTLKFDAKKPAYEITSIGLILREPLVPTQTYHNLSIKNERLTIPAVVSAQIEAFRTFVAGVNENLAKKYATSFPPGTDVHWVECAEAAAVHARQEVANRNARA